MTLDIGEVGSSGLILVWSILQTFGLEYFPWIKTKFEALPVGQKKTVNAGGLAIVTGGLYGLSLAGVANTYSPDLRGLLVALTAYFAALGIQYGVHKQTKKEGTS